MVDRVGQQFGNYRLVRLLGEGGFAEVYLGEHVQLYTQAAIKVLHTQLTSDDVEKFSIEAGKIARLIHPHIVRVLDFGVEDKTPYLVMDYAPNGTLRQRYHRGTPLVLSIVIDYVKQVADALQFAHNQKLIHRDIKPENMLLGQNNEILLSDFGIAIAAQSSRYQSAQDMAGTIAYMAPEQIQAHPLPASDQYSLGVVVYEWLTGDLPFHGSFNEVVIKYTPVSPPPLREKVPTIPSEVEQVVLTALAKDPKERFLTIQAFATALEQASSSTIIHSHIPLIPPSPQGTLSPGDVSSPGYSNTSVPAPPTTAGSSIPTSSPSSPILTPQAILRDGGNRGIYGQHPTELVDQISGFTQISRKQKSPKFGLVIGISLLLLALLGSSFFLYTNGIFPFSKNGNGSGGGSSSGTPTAAAKAPASQQIFRFAQPVSDLATLDPAQPTDIYSAEAVYAVFTGLVSLNDKLEVVPQMAANYTHSSDDLTWTLHLKQGLQFSDGTPITSHDVVYSIDRALSPQVFSLNGVSLTYLGLIKDSDKRVAGKISTIINDSLLTPDDNTVVIKLNKPGAYFLEALTYPTSFVVEKSVIDKYGLKFVDHLSDNGGQGGAGPFVVQSWNHNKNITFVPNPRYYGPEPQLSQLQFVFYKSTKTQYEVYQAGQIDATTGIPSENLQRAETTKEFVKVPQLSIQYFAMNYLVKPFDNIHIRQAFSLALNRDVINSAIFKGAYVPSCHIVPNGMPGYNPNLTCPGGGPTSGDQNKAKQLFQQGMQEEGLTTFPSITLTYANGDPDTDNMITTARQMWQTILGVDIKPNAIDYNQLVTDLNTTINNPKGLQMWQIGWIADYPDPQDWTTLQFDKGSPNNNTNYGQNGATDSAQQQQLQQQLEQADVTADSTQRFQMYNQAEQQLVNDVAWMSVFQEAATRLVKSYVVGLTFNATDLRPPGDWANVYIAVH